jgi:acetaldehyde dehydrogenase/alcohol dehydrogenase
VAPEKYATLGWILFGGRDDDKRRARLFDAVDELIDAVGLPRTLADAGVDEAAFEAALPELTRTAFADPSLRTNPRMPMIGELLGLLRQGFDGRAPG